MTRKTTPMLAAASLLAFSPTVDAAQRARVSSSTVGAAQLRTVLSTKQAPVKAAMTAQDSVATRNMQRLDRWLISRYRGAQLLPDSVGGQRSVAADASISRVESIATGGRFDTLFAVHFAEHASAPALSAEGSARLVAPTGSASSVLARIVARRPFRAPRSPLARNSNEGDWRYGWAYLTVLPKVGRTTPAATFRGWLMLEAGR